MYRFLFRPRTDCFCQNILIKSRDPVPLKTWIPEPCLEPEEPGVPVAEVDVEDEEDAGNHVTQEGNDHDALPALVSKGKKDAK